MAKHYRNLNGCVTKMHRVIYEAYDKGYRQAKNDYSRSPGKWEPEVINGVSWWRCGNCKRYAIANYQYCPHCGSIMEEDDGTKKEI